MDHAITIGDVLLYGFGGLIVLMIGWFLIRLFLGIILTVSEARDLAKEEPPWTVEKLPTDLQMPKNWPPGK